MDRAASTFDAETLRLAMRQWATGVTVVSAAFNDQRHGMTVSSFTSIALTPPVVLISLGGDTRTHGLVQKSGAFGVTILEQTQRDISDIFAGRLSDDQDRFAGLSTFSLVSGAPFIYGGLAFLDCAVISTFQAGNTTVFIGEVRAARSRPDGRPLLYYNRDYHTVDR